MAPPQEEQPLDHVQGEATLPPPPWWHGFVIPFVFTLAAMAVGGLALNWRSGAVRDTRISNIEYRVGGEIVQRLDAVETRVRYIEDHKLGDRYTSSDARRDWASEFQRHRDLEQEIEHIKRELANLRVRVAEIHRGP